MKLKVALFSIMVVLMCISIAYAMRYQTPVSKTPSFRLGM